MNGLQRALGISPTHPFRKFNLAFLAIALLALVLVPILMALHVNGITVGVVGIVGGVMLFTLIVMLIYGRGYARDVDRLLAGEYLVRWTFSPEEWSRFTEAEWKRTRKEAILTLAAVAVAAMVLGIILDSIEYSGGTVAIAVFLMLLVGALVSSFIYVSGKAVLSDTSGENHAIYVTWLGVYRPWGYMPISGFNLSLSGADIEEGSPSVLVLQSSYLTRYGRQTRTTRVPIPSGHESEARELMDQLEGS